MMKILMLINKKYRRNGCIPWLHKSSKLTPEEKVNLNTPVFI